MKETDEKKNAKTDEQIAEAGRECHFQKYLRETDQGIVDSLSQRYRHVALPERIKALTDLPTQFEERDRFDQSLRVAGGEPPPSGRVLGFSRYGSESAHVAVDHLQIPKTIAHERLHQLSDPYAPEILGRRLYEGMTEVLAREEIGTRASEE